MANLTNHAQVTEEQIAAATPLLTGSGERYYEVLSSTGEGHYTLRLHPIYHRWQCNCKWAREGVGSPCWHVRTVEHLEAIERDAAEHEAKAVKRDGARAYERKPFSLFA